MYRHCFLIISLGVLTIISCAESGHRVPDRAPVAAHCHVSEAAMRQLLQAQSVYRPSEIKGELSVKGTCYEESLYSEHSPFLPRFKVIFNYVIQSKWLILSPDAMWFEEVIISVAVGSYLTLWELSDITMSRLHSESISSKFRRLPKKAARRIIMLHKMVVEFVKNLKDNNNSCFNLQKTAIITSCKPR